MEVQKAMQTYRKSNNNFIKGICRKWAKLWGCCIGSKVQIGEGVRFIHNAVGTVIYTDTELQDNVWIYQNVTIGKADVWHNNDIKVVIHKGACLCAGAKILCPSNETLEIGENSVIAANAVVLHSVPPDEIWGGGTCS
ncbi:hypothetical protein [Clostridium transplantifaecale]|uniref:hypothetical protein n=1 Tax=Clostridium transplantifaecale TaxID=2479838 RepID=UPI000F63837E|nr:hypothetical protein [Clostridium transplantifaecale]